MEFEKITPAGRRVQRIAIRIGIFTALYAALEVNTLYDGSRFVAPLIIAIAFFLAYYFTSRLWLKRVILALAILFLVPLATLVFFTRPPYVSVSAPSPDGRVVAEIYEPPRTIDRNFVVRLKTKGRWGISRYKDYFRSPDEGLPPTERLLWSKDGRYLLLLGTRESLYTVRKEACLSSGECLYLLVDTEKDVVYTNASVRDPHPFSVDDLSGIDFGESFIPADKKAGGGQVLNRKTG